jgi:hypothetical protein
MPTLLFGHAQRSDLSVPSGHGLGLAPDVPLGDGANRAAPPANALQITNVHLHWSRGLGLAPDVAAGAERG